MRFRPLLLAFCLAFASCEQARRYPSVGEAPKTIVEKKPQEELHAHWAWMRPMAEPFAVPMEFVPPTAPDWQSLPKFWNQVPPAFAGRQTIHIGLPPLEAVAAMLMAERVPTTIRIKVPAGLPDPNPFIPAANPPTYAKWRLGKKLFFAAVLKSGGE